MISPVKAAENMPDSATNKKNNSIKVAEKIMRLSKDHILMHMRFLDVAMGALETRPEWMTGARFACDGKVLRYDPAYVIRAYKNEQSAIIRAYLHVLLHMIFCHPFRYEEMNCALWDLACDMAVEQTVMELSLPGTDGRKDLEKKQILTVLSKEVAGLSAEKLYRYFQAHPFEPEKQAEYTRLFRVDEHELWKHPEQINMTLAEWKKLTERLKTDLKSFSKGKTNSENLLINLTEATKERINYEEFLKRFMVSGEAMKVNEDEFDYIPYYYGLMNYGNMPLVEPLEYQEVEKVHDFVIALDTSASCSGITVQAFLKHTYAIMKTAGAFFEEMNVHILQCDSEVREDVIIRNQDDFDSYLINGRLTGGGATDFRPVFTHVNDMLRRGELTNLKGLIYFTDGYGIFPEKMPEYETVFVFVREDEGHMPLPPWAVKIVLEEDFSAKMDSDGDWEDEY